MCSQPAQLFDEVEYTSYIKTIIQASGPAYRSASDNARRNNAFFCRILLSTPGDLDSAPAQEAVEIINGSCKWTEKFYDMKKSEVDEYIEKNSSNGIVYIEYNHKQLGLDDEWVKRTAQTLLNDPLMIKREIYLKRIRGSHLSPFDQEDLEVISDSRGTIKEEIFINKFYRLNLYETLNRKMVYFVGVDCGTGVGNDNSAVVILDPYTEKPVGSFKSPFIGTEDFKKFLFILVKKYIPRAILCIERNHVGAAIMEGLKSLGLVNNIYFDKTKQLTGNVDEHLDESGFLKQQAFNRRLYGVYTEKGSRDLMMNILHTRISEYKSKFICDDVIDDILHLIRNKRGKIEAAPGFNDDSVMAYLMTMYVLIYGNNLERYGFVRGILLDENERNKGLMYEDDAYDLLPEEFKETFINNNISEDPSLSYAKEIFKEKTVNDIIDKITFNSNNFKITEDDEYDGSLPSDFFDELNN